MTNTEPKPPISIRIEQSILKALNEASQLTALTKTTIIKLGLIDILMGIFEEHNYDNVDLKKHLKIHKNRIKRDIQKIERIELMSKHLFMSRVKRTIMVYILKKRKVQDIKEILKAYKKEALTYEDNQSLLNELEYFDKELENNIEEFKNMLYEDLDAHKFLNDKK